MSANWYERHILPTALDLVCGMPMMGRMRQQVVPRAHGRVLEVGFGTGLNMRYYDKNRVTHITGLDPGLQFHPLAQERIAQSGLRVDLVGLSAEIIPLPDARFDTVLITYTLCTIPKPASRAAGNAPRAGSWRETAVLRARPRTRRVGATLAGTVAATVDAGGGRLPAGARHCGAAHRRGFCPARPCKRVICADHDPSRSTTGARPWHPARYSLAHDRKVPHRVRGTLQ
jgi:hypothetical protein